MATKPTNDYFEQHAGGWDETRAGYYGDEVRQAAFARAQLHPSMKVADLGGGTGYFSQALCGLVSQVTLLDASPAMLSQARSKLADLPNLAILQGEASDWPLEEGSQDAAFANMFLHHCPNPEQAIAEMARVLRPGGRLVITDLDTHHHTWMRDEMADLHLGFDRPQVLAWMRAAGLVNVYVECVNATCGAASMATPGQRDEVGIFVAVGSKHVPAHQAVRENYSLLAQNGCGCADNSCCAPGVVTLDDLSSAQWNTLYSAEDKASAPTAALEISLGCGNPLAMAALRPGEVVLDIGSGGGIDAFLAARRVGPGGHVYGVDMTPAMLEKARQTAQQAGIANVEFRQGYAEELPLPDHSVDVVISNCVINLTEDKGRAFNEACRVLRPGGRLEINDVVFEGPVPPEAWQNSGAWSECISGALPQSELASLLAQAGFGQVSFSPGDSHGNILGAPFRSAQISARKPTG